jgi:hypothetical protein
MLKGQLVCEKEVSNLNQKKELRECGIFYIKYPMLEQCCCHQTQWFYPKICNIINRRPLCAIMAVIMIIQVRGHNLHHSITQDNVETTYGRVG